MNELLIQLLRASSHTITGRLSADPDIKYLNSGTLVANASMAVNQLGAKREDNVPADWFKVTVWGEQAQAFADACHKADIVKISGRCKTETWTTRDGEKRTQWVITADQWELVRSAGGGNGAAPTAAPAPAQTGWASSAPSGDLDDSDVPF
jgi:single-strand DNA-binding protein